MEERPEERNDGKIIERDIEKEYEDFVKDKKEITCRCEAPDEGRTIKFNLKDYRSPAFILEKINKNKSHPPENLCSPDGSSVISASKRNIENMK